MPPNPPSKGSLLATCRFAACISKIPEILKLGPPPEKSCIRPCLPWRNSATEMFANLGIHSFDEMLRIFVFSFRSKVTASHNQLIFGLCTAHFSVYSKLWAWWNSLLHIYIEWHYLSYDLAPCKRILFVVYIFYLTAL